MDFSFLQIHNIVATGLGKNAIKLCYRRTAEYQVQKCGKIKIL
jgi:hypothetical protein